MNYYQIVLKKIDVLIDRKHYLQALEKIQYELNVPYLQKEFQEKLQKKLQKVINFLNKINRQKNFSFKDVFKTKFSLKVIQNLLLNNQGSEFHSLLFNFIKKENLSSFLKIIKNYFLSDKYSSQNKTLLLLRLQEIDCSLEFFVNKKHFSELIIPTKLPPLHDSLYQKMTNFITSKYQKEDVVFYKIALNINENIFLYFYPVIPFAKNYKILLAGIIYYAFQSLNKKQSLEDISLLFNVEMQDLRKINNLFKVNGI